MARGRGRKNAIVSVHLLFNFFWFPLFFKRFSRVRFVYAGVTAINATPVRFACHV